GAIARFVVIDDSSKSGHLVEVEICSSNRWVTILLRAGGKGGSWMTSGAGISSNVILEQAYEEGSPQPALSEAVSWAENKLGEIQARFDATYPWRQPPPEDLQAPPGGIE